MQRKQLQARGHHTMTRACVACSAGCLSVLQRNCWSMASSVIVEKQAANSSITSRSAGVKAEALEAYNLQVRIRFAINDI